MKRNTYIKNEPPVSHVQSRVHNAIPTAPQLLHNRASCELAVVMPGKWLYTFISSPAGQNGHPIGYLRFQHVFANAMIKSKSPITGISHEVAARSSADEDVPLESATVKPDTCSLVRVAQLNVAKEVTSSIYPSDSRTRPVISLPALPIVTTSSPPPE